MAIKYNKLFQLDQKFNNKITWEAFRTLPSWNEVIYQFENRIKNYFFCPIKKLYKYSFYRRLKYVHNFPISNICWSLLDLLAQLELGKNVNGLEVDKFMQRNSKYFININAAINLANSYQMPGSRYNFTLYDIFRNKPFHNAMVKGLGSLDNTSSDVFTINNGILNIDGKIFKMDYIIENPIRLYEAIVLYFKSYISYLKIDQNFKRNFKNRLESLFEFKFSII
ncbi:hypothetical protein LCGC14_2269330 [marine sediment metagenome]|uniref:Uncharacterized protein n=1 Tax=marine sediment metagenome TaxID=412755 RepID=A0A0F9DJN0_9ZZZZ